ncbi:hypothetical protein ACFPM0_00580 [Pseudonocardia sulfidoxydans]
MADTGTRVGTVPAIATRPPEVTPMFPAHTWVLPSPSRSGD